MPTSKPGPKPEFLRIGDNFHWRPPVDGDPVEYVIPLVFSSGFYRRLVAAGDPIQQLAMVLTEVEMPNVLAVVDDLVLDRGMQVSRAYFDAFNERMGALLGE